MAEKPKLPSNLGHDAPETVHPQDTPTPESCEGDVTSSTVSQVPPPPSQQNQPDGRNDNTPRWEKTAGIIIAAGTIGLLVVNFFQMCSTEKAAIAAKTSAEITEKSFKMARQRAEDSDEAICNVRGDLAIGETIEHLSVFNIGKVPAHNVRAHIEISRNSLPTNQRIALIQSWDMSEDELRTEPIVKDIPLPDFGKTDWDQMRKLHEAVEISGTITYENGFGSNRQKSFCHAEIVAPQSAGSTPMELAVLPECDTLPRQISRSLEILHNRK